MIKEIGIFGKDSKRIPLDAGPTRPIGLFIPPFPLGSMSSVDVYRLFNLWTGRNGIATNGEIIEIYRSGDNWIETFEEPFLGDYIFKNDRLEQIIWCDISFSHKFNLYRSVVETGKCTVNYAHIPQSYDFNKNMMDMDDFTFSTMNALFVASAVNPVLNAAWAPIMATANGIRPAKVSATSLSQPRHGDVI